MTQFRLLALSIAALTFISLKAETPAATEIEVPKSSFFKKMKSVGVFNRLDLALNVVTTGIGVEFASPVTEWTQVRVGFDWIPRISVPMSFDIQNYTDDGKFSDANFSSAQNLIKDLTGYDIDETIIMDGIPTISTFKFLVDVYPFKNNRHWHFTAGFYVGNRQVAKARNTMGEMPTLISIGMYNRLYEYVMKTDFMDTPLPIPGFDNIYLDPDVADKLKEKMEKFGRLGVHLGDYKDGRPYIMEPSKDGLLTARAFVNAFRPYVGFGYGGTVSKDKRWNVSFDCGAMMWGGSPDVITHDGVNMMDELVDVPGKVGRYLDLMRIMKVYPVLNFRIAYKLF